MLAEARTVVVEPPSSRREALQVARAVFHIGFWSAALIALERGDDSSAGLRAAAPSPPARNDAVAVGEVALRDLDPREQELFRALDAVVPQLERDRAATGAWPTVEELAGRGVAPFVNGPPDYRWKLVRENVVTNYVALPDAAGGRPTFALTIVEPQPGVPGDPQATPDEIHHRLGDGTLLHVGIWKAPGVRSIERPLAAPAPEDGWRRVTQKPR